MGHLKHLVWQFNAQLSLMCRRIPLLQNGTAATALLGVVWGVDFTFEAIDEERKVLLLPAAQGLSNRNDANLVAL